jgi:DNA-binding MarR family transcriptional regulator
MAAKRSKPQGGVADTHAPTYPEPITQADRVIIEMRKFITAAVLLNARTAEKLGLTMTDVQVISVLQLYGPSTPTRLGAATGLSSGGITVALDRLEKAGYIRRQPNPSDRRSLLIALVPSALAKLAKFFEGANAGARKALATLPERDLDAMIRFFETMREHREPEQSK